MNMYTYVGNNPTSFVDPLGLCKAESAQKYEQLRSYVNATAQAITRNIAVLEKSHAGQERLRAWYMGTLVADTAMSAISAAKTSVQVTRGALNWFGARTGSFKGNPFPGKGGLDYSKANLGERQLLGEIEGFFRDNAIPLMFTGISFVPILEKPASHALDLIDIGKGRRKAVGKYDPLIEQALINISVLSQSASSAIQAMQRLQGNGWSE